ncbi:PREDICTED: uncharacterized protein LOC108375329 [Rhagoletis zephyria]|uniref:uncharacterized protein LOC108375329 n=1 Tax=Rhagoletis zephyria TaxID=28612 RepID=UPI0008117448|nr:PREDICTED: uncharacterized protein LOC108375329 [Rhagoletis zephyria]
METVLSEICDNMVNTIIIGDFNINLNIMSTYSKKLNEIFAHQAIKQLINFNTRVTEYPETLIDLLYSNAKEVSCEKAEEHRISDHETIMFKCDIKKQGPISKLSEITSWDGYSPDNL